MRCLGLNMLMLLVFSCSLLSCKPKISENDISKGQIDGTRFIAIGGSTTAGFMNDALYYEGQINSLGNIIGEQLKLIGGTEFVQPMMLKSSVGCNKNGNSPYQLAYKTDCLGTSSLSPVRIAGNGDLAGFNQYIFRSDNCNYGIPEIKSTELNLAGYGNLLNGQGYYNPYFTRFCSDVTNASVLSDLNNRNPTFFSVFIGVDEVIAYAKSGAEIGQMAPVNGVAGSGFDGSMEQLLNLLTQSGAKGVIGNIPDVTLFPYFTTIPYNGLNLTADKTETMNAIYNPIGISFHDGNNSFVIEDPGAGDFGVRLMEPGELLLLSIPLDSVKCNQMGSVFPIREEFVLTLDEIEEIRFFINQYNEVLQKLALQYNLAYVDVYSFIDKLESGMVVNGIPFSAKFVSGGTFSLDGLNLHARGNALLANEFIKAINGHYRAKIPLTNITRFEGVRFP